MAILVLLATDMDQPVAIDTVDTSLRPNADPQFESLLREAQNGGQHAQTWDTGDVFSNGLSLLLPAVVTVAFHKYPAFTFAILNAAALWGFRFLIRAKLKDERQMGLCLILGALMGAFAWVACLTLFGPGNLYLHTHAASPAPAALNGAIPGIPT